MIYTHHHDNPTIVFSLITRNTRHNIIRPNQDQFLDEDRFANQQLTEIFFIKTPYLFTLNIFDKKHDHIISEALVDIQAYESFYDKCQLFSLTFHFLSPQERDLYCSHDIMLRTKLSFYTKPF